MNDNTGQDTVAVETITAATLRVGDDLIDGPAVRHITSVRLQGTPPEACVEMAGIPGRRHFTVATRVQVRRGHRPTS